MPLTEQEIYAMMKGKDAGLATKAFDAGMGFAGSQALSKSKALLLAGRPDPLAPISLPFTVAMVGLKKLDPNFPDKEATLAFDVGKFITFTCIVGAAALPVGGLALAISVVGYLNDLENERDKARRQEIAASMAAKYKAILEKVELKKLFNDARTSGGFTDAQEVVYVPLKSTEKAVPINVENLANVMKVFAEISYKISLPLYYQQRFYNENRSLFRSWDGFKSVPEDLIAKAKDFLIDIKLEDVAEEKGGATPLPQSMIGKPSK